MSPHRWAAIAAMVIGALLFGGTGVASAQNGPARLTKVVPISGTSKDGKQKLSGTYTIERFIAKGNKLYSVGTVKGKLGKKKVTKDNVRLPASVANASGTAGAARASQVPPLPLPPLPPGNACSILSLDLGPINLNLLGLVVRTNQIQLRIDAVQGPGNLLGNLLCGITGSLIRGRSRTRPSLSSPRFSTRYSHFRLVPPLDLNPAAAPRGAAAGRSSARPRQRASGWFTLEVNRSFVTPTTHRR